MNPNLHDEITKVAFDLYQKEGCPEGRHLFHWLEAEKIVKERHKVEQGEASVKTTDTERPEATKGRSGSRKKRNP